MRSSVRIRTPEVVRGRGSCGSYLQKVAICTAGEPDRYLLAVTAYGSVTPRIVTGDVEGLVAFLRAVFDADAEIVAGRPVDVRIGDSIVLVSGEGERDTFPAFLYVYVDDADATYERAVATGAVTVEAPLDTPYGDRRAMVRDPWGNVFQIAHRLPS
jgi:uncharacterized glyoxalase superfamily protein PhnB